MAERGGLRRDLPLLVEFAASLETNSWERHLSLAAIFGFFFLDRKCRSHHGKEIDDQGLFAIIIFMIELVTETSDYLSLLALNLAPMHCSPNLNYRRSSDDDDDE